MRIAVIMVMHSLVNEPLELVKSLSGPETTFHVFVHSTYPQVTTTAAMLGLYADVRVHLIGRNQGLSRSWNQGLIDAQLEGAEVLMIVNDDVIATRDDMLKIAQGAVDHRDAFMSVGLCLHQFTNDRSSSQFAMCAINPIALETVGYFDENIWPYLCEDCDWFHRLSLAGLTWHNVGETSLLHLGSASAHQDPVVAASIQVTAPLITQYYVKKWGGSIGQEVYPVPFNDPACTLKIEAGARHHPYPGYDRTDIEGLMAP